MYPLMKKSEGLGNEEMMKTGGRGSEADNDSSREKQTQTTFYIYLQFLNSPINSVDTVDGVSWS